jgi:hypothetical protein
MAQEAGGNEMESVKNYFNTAGFERWNKIYGTTSVRSGAALALAPPAHALYLRASGAASRLQPPAPHGHTCPASARCIAEALRLRTGRRR